MRYFFLGLAGFCTLLTGCARENPNLVKIALVCPLTGDVAAMGQGMKRSAEMAVANLNAAKRFGEKIFELEVFDDRADPKEAVNVANQIVSESRILGVVGHLNSGCSIPASQVYARQNLVMITPASTNPKLTLQGLKNVFRVCTTDDVQGTFAAEYAVRILKCTRAAIIQDKTAYGQGIAESFKKRLEELKGVALGFDGINSGEKDFKALLTSLAAKKPDLVYFGGVYMEGALLTKQAREVGLTAPLFSGDGCFSPEFIKIAGPASEGVYFTMMGQGDEGLPQAGQFAEQYRARYPGVERQPYDVYTYDAVNILIAAGAGAQWDPAKVAEQVARTRYDGLIGKTSFDQNGDTQNKTTCLYRVENGKFARVK